MILKVNIKFNMSIIINYTRIIIRLRSVNKVMVGLRYEFGKL